MRGKRDKKGRKKKKSRNKGEKREREGKGTEGGGQGEKVVFSLFVSGSSPLFSSPFCNIFILFVRYLDFFSCQVYIIDK